MRLCDFRGLRFFFILYFLHSEMNLVQENYMSYDNFEHSSAKGGTARRPRAGGRSYSKIKDWKR